MTIRWTEDARTDVERLVDFIAASDPALASEIEQELSFAPRKLLQFRHRGARLSEFAPREVRELRVGRYLLRYEIAAESVIVLRFFHGREDRF